MWGDPARLAAHVLMGWANFFWSTEKGVILTYTVEISKSVSASADRVG